MANQGAKHTVKWANDELKLAFRLYCQLPFGKLHARNPQIIGLSDAIGRTPSALAMKLVNFASLDPAVRERGRRGLGNASAADREVWEEFHSDWQKLALECEAIANRLGYNESVEDRLLEVTFPETTREATARIRIGQRFFRKAVLASYQWKCCMSGVSVPQLLVASHIIPWSIETSERLNPRNGLCLSAIHDRAFDAGLLTLLPGMTIKVSNELKAPRVRDALTTMMISLDGKRASLPEKFLPSTPFLEWHNKNIFRG